MTTRIDANIGLGIRELQRRQYDALTCFRPLRNDDPEQSQEAYFRCRATQKLISGGNQSGKTTITCVRDAAFLLDRPITLPDGTQFNPRKKMHRGRPVLAWIIGLDLDHIGQTIYPKIFQPGAFKLIRDPQTKLMRAWNPLNEYDAAYEEKAVPAPPLINPDTSGPDVSDISWEYKAEHQFSTVTMRNGARLCAYSSKADVKQGDQVHRIHIDEAIDNPNHFNEWLQRIAPVRGEIDWSTWPTIDPNSALIGLWDLCQRDRNKEKPRGVMFRFPQINNPYLPKETREEIISTGQMDEEELQARSEGLFVMDKRRMYPTFSRRTHGLLAYDPADDENDPVATICREKGQIPADWTRYLALDPGTSHPAVLFCAVPPPSFGQFLVCYDELYPGRKDADELAELVLAKTKGQMFEAFFIDNHAARMTPMGVGFTVGDNYKRAFRQRNLQSRRTRHGFLPGSDDVMGRIMQVQAGLNLGTRDKPYIRVWVDRCPNLCRQMEAYRKAIDPKTKALREEPDKNQKIDMAVCLEYMVSKSPTYVRPFSVDEVSISNIVRDLAERFGLKKPQSNRVHCGPGAVDANA